MTMTLTMTMTSTETPPSIEDAKTTIGRPSPSSVVVLLLLLVLGVSLFRSRHPHSVFDRRPTDVHSMKLNRNLRRSVSQFRNRFPVFSLYLWRVVKNVNETEHVCHLARDVVLKHFWRFSPIVACSTLWVLMKGSVYHAVAAYTTHAAAVVADIEAAGSNRHPRFLHGISHSEAG